MDDGTLPDALSAADVSPDDLARVGPSDVRITLTRSIWLGAPPESCGPPMHQWSIQVLADLSDEERDRLRVIIGHGSAETYSLDGEAIVAADDYSGDAGCCIDAVLGPDGFPRPEFGLEAMGTRVGHIDRLWPEPPVRGRGLGLAVLRACTDAISPGCFAIVIHPAPTEPDAMTDAVFQVARRKLYAYWQRAGFLPLPDDPHHLVHDPSRVVDDQVGDGAANAWRE